jgi:hypothetical protein
LTDITLSFTQSGGFAGLRKGCVVPLNSLTPKAKAGLAVLRRLKKASVPTGRGRDLLFYRLDLKGPGGKKSIQFDDQTAPKKARPLIAFLSAQSRPIESV